MAFNGIFQDQQKCLGFRSRSTKVKYINYHTYIHYHKYFTFRLLSSFSDGEHDFIALEDLSYKGYKTAEREGSVNFDQTKLGLILMAKFHALSIALRDQKPEFDNVASDIQVCLNIFIRQYIRNFIIYSTFCVNNIFYLQYQ